MNTPGKDSTNQSFPAIDLSITNSTFAPQTECQVLDEYKFSDHCPILITLLHQMPKISLTPHWKFLKPNRKCYKRLINKNVFKNTIQIDIENKMTQIQINSITTQFSNIILNAANKSLKETTTTHKKKTVL